MLIGSISLHVLLCMIVYVMNKINLKNKAKYYVKKSQRHLSKHKTKVIIQSLGLTLYHLLALEKHADVINQIFFFFSLINSVNRPPIYIYTQQEDP